MSKTSKTNKITKMAMHIIIHNKADGNYIFEFIQLQATYLHSAPEILASLNSLHEQHCKRKTYETKG